MAEFFLEKVIKCIELAVSVFCEIHILFELNEILRNGMELRENFFEVNKNAKLGWMYKG